MKRPAVTVVLSSLNHGRFVAAAIQSILDQTFQDFELFIVDDASEDDSWDVIRRFTDPRIKAIRNPTRMRAAYGFNRIIRDMAAGEFIAIHHSDDAWLPTKLERQVALLGARPDVGAVFTRVEAIDESGAPLAASSHPYQTTFQEPNRDRFAWLRHFFLVGNCLCHPSVLARKRPMIDAGLYDRRLGQVTDFDLWVRICLRHEIHILEERLVRFRILRADGNQSAWTEPNQMRLRNELPIVFARYLGIDGPADLKAIFPEASVGDRLGRDGIQFALAMRAIEAGTPLHIQFGLSTLYRLMSDERVCAALTEAHGFSYADLIALAGRLDPLQYVKVDQLARERDRLVQTLSWRITEPLRRLQHLARRTLDAARRRGA